MRPIPRAWEGLQLCVHMIINFCKIFKWYFNYNQLRALYFFSLTFSWVRWLYHSHEILGILLTLEIHLVCFSGIFLCGFQSLACIVKLLLPSQCRRVSEISPTHCVNTTKWHEGSGPAATPHYACVLQCPILKLRGKVYPDISLWRILWITSHVKWYWRSGSSSTICQNVSFLFCRKYTSIM